MKTRRGYPDLNQGQRKDMKTRRGYPDSCCIILCAKKRYENEKGVPGFEPGTKKRYENEKGVPGFVLYNIMCKEKI